MSNKQELKICFPIQFHDHYSWRSNEDEIYPKDVIYIKPISHHIHSKVSLVIEFSSLHAPQRVDVFGGDNKSGSGYQHSIFHHIKTLYVSPHVSISSKIHRMRLLLELNEHDLHQFYRLLLFPSLTSANPHRVCEILSVYLHFEPTISIVTPPHSPQEDQISTTPTPPKGPKRSFKSMFRRNQKIHIGLTRLSSDVLSALFSSNDVVDTSHLTPKLVENLIDKWMQRMEETSKIRSKSRLHLLEFHFREIEWVSHTITFLQQYSWDEEIKMTLRKTQRDSPYMITSINKLRNRLIQILQLIVNSNYLDFLTLPQPVFPIPQDDLSSRSISPIFSQWVQSEMSVQNTLQQYYLHAYPVLKSIHFNLPTNLLNVPLTQTLHGRTQIMYSLIQHLFITLWIETCQSYFTLPGCENMDICIFQFQSDAIHLMTEESVEEELVRLNQTSKIPDMIFFIHQYRFFSSIQNLISSLSDFRLLFQSDTYYFVPPPAPLPIPKNISTELPNVDDDSDDDSIPDIDEVIEKAISDFISKDGFDEEDTELQRQRKFAEPSLPAHDAILHYLHKKESSSDIVTKEQEPIVPKNIQARKLRSIISLLSSLPQSIQLSSSHSLDLQLFKVSEAIICSSIIAFHHLLKYDVNAKYWFEAANYIKRIHSGEYIQGGSVSLQSLDYPTIVYSLMLVIPSLMVGRVHISSFSYGDTEMNEKLSHQTLYTIRNILVFLAEKKHIGVNLVSAILSEILRVCLAVLCYPVENISEDYLASLFFLYSDHEIQSKKLLCQNLAILCFECMCQLLMGFSFDTSIDSSFSKPAIESLVLLFLVPHVDSKVQEAAQRVLQRFHSQFPKYIVELHQRTQERKKLIVEKEEQVGLLYLPNNYDEKEKRDKELRDIREAEERARVEKERLEREQCEREERERKEKEDRELKEREEEAKRLEEIKLQQDKEEKYGKMLKARRKNHSVMSVLEELQRQQEEEERKEQALREKREREIQEEFEREKEKRLKELKDQQEKETLRKKAKEEEELKRKEELEMEEKMKKEQNEKEKMKQEEGILDEGKHLEEEKKGSPDINELHDVHDVTSNSDPSESKVDLKDLENPTSSPTKRGPDLESLAKSSVNSAKDNENSGNTETPHNSSMNSPKQRENIQQETKESKSNDGVGRSGDDGSGGAAGKKKDKKKKKPEEVVYEWQDRPSKKKGGGGGCLLL